MEATGGKLQRLVRGQARPHEIVSALIEEMTTLHGSVLVLEDVHWADEATLDILRLLGRRVETAPALVVVSYRDDELVGTHPLRIVLGELATSRSVDRLEVSPLSRDA